jgi:hypothetical protein
MNCSSIRKVLCGEVLHVHACLCIVPDFLRDFNADSDPNVNLTHPFQASHRGSMSMPTYIHETAFRGVVRNENSCLETDIENVSSDLTKP